MEGNRRGIDLFFGPVDLGVRDTGPDGDIDRQALANRLERRGLGSPDDLMAERMTYLEGEVDRLSSEVSRLTEETDFLQNLLADRPTRDSLPPGDTSE